MKFKVLTRIFSLLLILSFINIQFITISANKSNLLEPYISLLESFNQKYNTHYGFPNADQLARAGNSYEEMINFYTNMTLSEFNDYLKAIYKREINPQTPQPNNKISEYSTSL